MKIFVQASAVSAAFVFTGLYFGKSALISDTNALIFIAGSVAFIALSYLIKWPSTS